MIKYYWNCVCITFWRCTIYIYPFLLPPVYNRSLQKNSKNSNPEFLVPDPNTASVCTSKPFTICQTLKRFTARRTATRVAGRRRPSMTPSWIVSSSTTSRAILPPSSASTKRWISSPCVSSNSSRESRRDRRRRGSARPSSPNSLPLGSRTSHSTSNSNNTRIRSDRVGHRDTRTIPVLTALTTDLRKPPSAPHTS